MEKTAVDWEKAPDAYKNGFNSFCEGFGRDMNPHKEHSADGASWLAGYLAAEESAKKD